MMHPQKIPNIERVPTKGGWTITTYILPDCRETFVFTVTKRQKTDAQERRGGLPIVPVDALYGRNSGIPHARGSTQKTVCKIAQPPATRMHARGATKSVPENLPEQKDVLQKPLWQICHRVPKLALPARTRELRSACS